MELKLNADMLKRKEILILISMFLIFTFMNVLIQGLSVLSMSSYQYGLGFIPGSILVIMLFFICKMTMELKNKKTIEIKKIKPWTMVFVTSIFGEVLAMVMILITLS